MSHEARRSVPRAVLRAHYQLLGLEEGANATEAFWGGTLVFWELLVTCALKQMFFFYPPSKFQLQNGGSKKCVFLGGFFFLGGGRLYNRSGGRNLKKMMVGKEGYLI